jgi:tetratricopeptide (TPR) repeat protein
MALWERFHAGAYAEAADGARSLLAATPEDGGLHFLLGQSLQDGGLDPAGALAAYDAALRAGHDPFWVLAGRARLRKDMGRNDEAVRDYLRAAILRPLNPAAARLLAHALLLIIRHPRARAG